MPFRFEAGRRRSLVLEYRNDHKGARVIFGYDTAPEDFSRAVELARQAAERYGTNPIPNIIPHLHDARFALMDTMEDTICNTLGTVIVMIFLKFFPYNHKGKRNVDDRIDALLAQDRQKGAAQQKKESVAV